MRLSFAFLVCVATACSSAADSGNEGTPPGAVVAHSNLQRDAAPVVSSADAATFGRDSRAFALALYRELADSSDNLFFSPYSVASALAMTYAGASGRTQTQMRDALHFSLAEPALHAAFNAASIELVKRKTTSADGVDGRTGDGFDLRTINQAWGQPEVAFTTSYLDVLATNYGAGMYLVDFSRTDETRRLINDWVADNTEQRIEELLPDGSIGGNTVLVLTNAIYFKASWLREFDPAKTESGKFMSPTAARDVQLMNNVQALDYAEVAGFQAVSLPFVSDDTRMVLVLPPAGPFQDAMNALDAPLFERLIGELEMTLVTLKLPKWSFQSEYELKEPLRALGMLDAFDGAADFSRMTGESNGLQIDEVFHKTFVAIDERGTEAAAASAVPVGRGILDRSISLTFDRPFLFFVYDEPTGLMLFAGQLVDPG